MRTKLKQKIIVCGATGNQGAAVADALLHTGYHVRALTRQPLSPAAFRLANVGAEICQGDFADPASLSDAMVGMDAMFLMGTPYEAGIDQEIAHAKSAIDAAIDAGLSHVVYSSGGSVDQRTGIPHFDSKMKVETYLQGSGVPTTILGPVFFMENFLGPLWLPALRNSQLPMALPIDRSMQMISMQDIAAFAVAAFRHSDQFAGKRIDVASDELSCAHVVEILYHESGRRIEYVELPLAAMRELGEDFAFMFDWFNRVGYTVDIAQLRQDHPSINLASFESWAKRSNWRTLLAA